MRPQKPHRKTKAYILDLILPPGCPDYMAMKHAVMGIPKPPLPEESEVCSCREEEDTKLDGLPA